MSVNFTEIENYFNEKVEAYKNGPNAVDWNGDYSQLIRFEQLLKVLPSETSTDFSICDFGCGLGAFFKFLQDKGYSKFNYTGVDISKKMIESAKLKNNQFSSSSTFICSRTLNRQYDYIVESGIFNVKNETSNESWLEYIIQTLDSFDNHSTKGFAFNCLTKYSDNDKMKNYLYYADPLFLFDWCKTHYSRNVALLHDYEVYDFTIIVRK